MFNEEPQSGGSELKITTEVFNSYLALIIDFFRKITAHKENEDELLKKFVPLLKPSDRIQALEKTRFNDSNDLLH
jgi:hypothetical protein